MLFCTSYKAWFLSILRLIFLHTLRRVFYTYFTMLTSLHKVTLYWLDFVLVNYCANRCHGGNDVSRWQPMSIFCIYLANEFGDPRIFSIKRFVYGWVTSETTFKKDRQCRFFVQCRFLVLYFFEIKRNYTGDFFKVVSFVTNP